MKQINLILFSFLFIQNTVFSQNVGIGTATPNAKAVLELKSTDKGVLFPRLTSAQRNAITNPPDGLHIYNTDEHCLNYYDSAYLVWNCYCENDTCKTVTITINEDTSAIDFYTGYAIKYPQARKFIILITEDVTINGKITTTNVTNITLHPAIDFSTMPVSFTGTTVKIINHGAIYGFGGHSGDGATGLVGGDCNANAANGSAGGNAIETNYTSEITVINYGLVAGGGGGGGGGGRAALGQLGGGGGGGAGIPFTSGGIGGGNSVWNCNGFGYCVCLLSGSNIAANGTGGTNVIGGVGGNGANGGGNGGNAGGLGQTGQNGTGTNAGTGGTAGWAILGGSGKSSISNFGTGQSFGVVD